jgi:riboflavin synthase
MFTGIIEDIGTVRAMQPAVLSIATRLDDIAAGDSVAVNGVCLTATTIRPQKDGGSLIAFDYSPETARRSNLVHLRAGDRVNIERALRFGSRVGGHMVSGHVEATAVLRAVRRQGAFRVYTFSLPESAARYTVSKGSTTVDGISLTVTDVAPGTFSVAVVPHTIATTTLAERMPGDTVNIEPDILAKYAERAAATASGGGGITREFLARNGF